MNKREISQLTAAIDKLDARCGRPSSSKGTRCCLIREQNVRSKLLQWGILPSGINIATTAALKGEIERNRLSKTRTCREIERAISETLAGTPLPDMAMAMLWDRVVSVFQFVQDRRPSWMPVKLNLQELRWLREKGNSRLQFHAMRNTLSSLRSLMLRLTQAWKQGDYFLQDMHASGVVDASQLVHFVENAAFGDVEEILSPPEHLRRIWKDVAKARIAPEDGGQEGPYTKYLWQTSSRVCDITSPRASEEEVKIAFGASAMISSHAQSRFRYTIGAHKYNIVENDPIVLSATDKGLYMSSGPSGTAYRFLTLWLVLGGAKDQLPLLRLLKPLAGMCTAESNQAGFAKG
ncbi:MAG: hypothetical protein Q9227_000865 [Pyrenula ochraceoflavens]